MPAINPTQSYTQLNTRQSFQFQPGSVFIHFFFFILNMSLLAMALHISGIRDCFTVLSCAAVSHFISSREAVGDGERAAGDSEGR